MLILQSPDYVQPVTASTTHSGNKTVGCVLLARVLLGKRSGFGSVITVLPQRRKLKVTFLKMPSPAVAVTNDDLCNIRHLSLFTLWQLHVRVKVCGLLENTLDYSRGKKT